MKDERLFMTFPNDMHRHPKLTRISVAARWAFVEMNGEARLNDNDGVFSAEDAEFMWSPDLLAELVDSHPTKPLVQRVDDTYVIREYAKHQQTRAQKRQRPHIPNSIRAFVMKRDGYKCQFCGATRRLQLDHIVRFRDGGPDTPENLRVLCKPCNIRRG